MSTKKKPNSTRPKVARKPDKSSNRYRIIGCDGEGYFNTEIESHVYDVFTAGNETIVGNGNHIMFYDIVDLLKRQALDAYRTGYIPIFIGYFYDYDVTQMIRSFDDFELSRLYEKDNRRTRRDKKDGAPRYKRAIQTTSMVSIDDGDKFSPRRFKIDIMPEKSMTIKVPFEDSLPKAQRNSNQELIDWATIDVQDVGSIFDSSFIAAMEAFQIPMTDDERQQLHDGKAGRSINATYAEREEMIDEIVAYNRLEIGLIYRLISRLVDTLQGLGVQMDIERDLQGIGTLAGNFLSQMAEEYEIVRSYNLAAEIGEEVYMTANNAFFGGHMETVRPGLHKDMVQADITSAYPFIMSSLPSLEGAISSDIMSAERANRAVAAGSIVFAEISYYGASDILGALPFRTHDDNVLRPKDGRGVYLWTEVQAADRAGLLKEVIWHKGWAVTPVSKEKPFAFMLDLYAERLRVGKKSVRGMMIKLLMNSIYGKLAQAVGNPEFANPIYACLITAGTRIMLLDAIGSHPKGEAALLATATDAVFFDSVHPGLDTTENTLGAWEETFYDQAFLMKPGIWGGVEKGKTDWDIAEIKHDDTDVQWKLKTRGIGEAALREKLHDEILPTMAAFERNREWDESYSFNTSNSWSMMTLGEGYVRDRLDLVGEFMMGDHGVPELIRDVSFNLHPKRTQVEWNNDLNGFISFVPIVFGDKSGALPVSSPRDRIIGNVDFKPTPEKEPEDTNRKRKPRNRTRRAPSHRE